MVDAREMNKKRSSKEITREKLEYLFNVKKFTIKELAKYFNCSESTINRYKTKWKIYQKGIRNKYVVEEKFVKIKINCKDEFYWTVIDKETFDKIKNITVRWSGYKGWNEEDVYVECRNKKTNNKYLFKEVKTNTVKLHRLIMNFPSDSEHVIDHINNDTLDNRKSNLRIVNRSINALNYNQDRQEGIGVNKHHGKWRARININNKEIHLGCFENKKDAIAARKEAEKKYWENYKDYYDNIC